MKRLLIVLGFLLGLSVQGQNTLSLTGGSGHPGDTVTVTISMTNSNAVTAMQTFVPLGTQLSYVPGSATLTSRSNGHQLTATVMNGSLCIYSYSLALASYNGTSGALLTFHVVLGREPGSYTLTPTQSVLSSASGASLAVSNTSGSITIYAPKVQVTPTSLNYGHVPIRSSYTRTVTVRNIGNEPLSISNITFDEATLGCSATNLTIAAGSQQSVTITYLPVTAGAVSRHGIFHSNALVGDSVLTINADPYSVNELRPLSVSGYTDSIVTVELRMNNMDSIVGLQTSIKLPQALTYIDGSFSVDATRTPGHTATAGLQGDTLTLLLTSLTGTPMHGADGVVGSFQLRLHGYGSHTLQLRNTALSDSAGNNVLSSVYSGTVYIYSPYLSCNSSVNFGNTPVTEVVTASLPLYNSGNAPLVIERAVFTQHGWRMLSPLPLTIGTYGRDTLRVTYNGTAEGNHTAQMLLYTNDPRNILKIISLTAERYEPNSLYLEGNVDATATTPEVDIMLDNYSAVTALQMDVQYPHNNFTLEPNDIMLTSRSNGHVVSAARLDDSTLRVLVLSMQNSPFNGNNGAVARLQLHSHDSLSTESYPIMLSNITSGCIDGIDRLTSIQNVGWFATRLVRDTTYIHDTSYVDVYVPVHDTTVVILTDTITLVQLDTIVQRDTLVQLDTVTLTEYVPVHDTTVVFLTDTVTIVQLDTVTLVQLDTVTLVQLDTVTLMEYVPVHDTTVVFLTDTVTLVQLDTVTLVQLDTVTLTEYVPVHDTTVVFLTDKVTIVQLDTIVQIDTLVQLDTVTLTEYVPVHDTTIVTLTDTVSIVQIDTLVQIDTMVFTDTLWLTQYDTLWLHDTIVIHDTIYVPQEGIGDAAKSGAKIFTSNGQIVVESMDGGMLPEVRVFDTTGRRLETRAAGNSVCVPVPASGVYLIKVGEATARRVVVIR